ncbi:MAG: imidazole glycerol phosphate synthase subunit HisH [Nitrososphaerota archaeon]
MKIGILNYGIGNLYSLTNAFRRLGVYVEIFTDLSRSEIDGLVLPGVGNFEAAARNISLMREEIIEVFNSSMPILGICLGMQLFFERSEEGAGSGLGVFSGEVVRFRIDGKLPHIGWNTLSKVKDSPILENVNDGEWVYYVHSYYAIPRDRNIVLAETNYGVNFPSVVGSSSKFGTQFHPEKSSTTGQKILKNFLNICKK